MMRGPEQILTRFKKRWILLEVVWIVILSMAPAVLVFLLTSSVLWSVLVLAFTLIAFTLFRKPYDITTTKVCRFLDDSLPNLEYSSWLLLKPKENLSGIARLQTQRVSNVLNASIRSVSPPINIKVPVAILLSCLVLGLLGNHFNIFSNLQSSPASVNNENTVKFQPIDSALVTNKRPKILNQEVSIHFPSYTGLAKKTATDMNIKAVEGSRVTWTVGFDTIIEKIAINSAGQLYEMTFNNGKYKKTMEIKASGFYHFEFQDRYGVNHISDLYSIERIKDNKPEIVISGIDEYNDFEFFEPKILNIKAAISDDFGIADAYIIATLSSGEGEAVQFREEKLNFEDELKKGKRHLNLSKEINLDNLNMKPGDELYFYIEALDYKTPKPNIGRSETFFAVIRDTLQVSFAVEGTMGADLMPDYFRSQRQLIIDTKKLIKDKKNLSEKDFKFKSNELGFDQKALRLKYGQFLGDEADSGLAISSQDEEEAEEQISNGQSDPLAEYTHDHDSEDHQHDDQLDTKEDEEDPLHDYLHDHDDAEKATLFEKSLKAKLREAMDQMWDSELYLRLYKPEQSLPYQYKALKLIQEIKNDARIYVHRIGFDPPPIKEESRLTGELKEIGNYRKQENFEMDEGHRAIKNSISILEEVINRKRKLSSSEKSIFEEAGNKLAVLAIESPGKFLQIVQNLKWLSEGIVSSKDTLIKTQSTLFKLINELENNPGKHNTYISELNQLLLKELSVDD